MLMQHSVPVPWRRGRMLRLHPRNPVIILLDSDYRRRCGEGEPVCSAHGPPSPPSRSHASIDLWPSSHPPSAFISIWTLPARRVCWSSSITSPRRLLLYCWKRFPDNFNGKLSSERYIMWYPVFVSGVGYMLRARVSLERSHGNGRGHMTGSSSTNMGTTLWSHQGFEMVD